MRRRPRDVVIDWWLVLAACVASIGTAVTGFDHPNRVTLIGIGNPVIRALVIWVLAVGVQAAAWFAWTTTRRR